MGNRTSIEWTRGEDGKPGSTWNPYRGTKGSFHCTKVSPGCQSCYAETYNIRGLHGKSLPFKVGVDKIRIDDDALLLPLRWQRPRKVFVNSMSDTFHETVPAEQIARLFAVMALAHRQTFLVLTKRSERARRCLSDVAFWYEVAEWEKTIALRLGSKPRPLSRMRISLTGGLPNVWIGASVENQEWFDKRIDHLRATPAAIRFLSMEPLLGAIDVREKLDGISWCIVGGESGRNARPMGAKWATDIIEQCGAAGVARHFKQWGEWLEIDLQHYLKAPLRGDSRDGRRVKFDGEWRELRETMGGAFVRMGKKAAGRQINGREWNEFPE
jgi:protein gp37